MEKVKKNKTGIEAIFDRLFKSTKNDLVEDEEEIEDKPFVAEGDEEVPAEDEAEETTDEPTEEEPAEEELEKSEDYDEESEEEIEENEEEYGEEIEYDDFVAKVSEEVMNIVDQRLADIEDILNGILDNQDKQNEAIEETVDNYEKSLKENQNLKKSLSDVTEKLEDLKTIRKSVTNVRTNERFDEKKVDLMETLTKSQKAEILANLLEQGNPAITIGDVANMELGAPISDRAQRALQKAINK